MEPWQNQLYQNYINNKMSPQGRQNYESDIQKGVIPRPEGFGQPMQNPVEQQPDIPAGIPAAHEQETKPFVLPDQVLKDFWDGKMSDEGMKNLISDARKGLVTTEPNPDPSFLESVKESITGEGKRVPETEKLYSWTFMPEMNNLSVPGALSLIGTMAAGPDEIATTIKKQWPKVEVGQDSKGNYVFTSGIDGNQYAIKPGIRPQEDFLRAGSTLMVNAIAAAYAGAGMLSKMGAAALTQAGIEASQGATGGRFDAIEIPVAAAMEGGGHLVGKGLAGIKGYLKGAPEAVKNAFKKIGVNIGENVPTALEKTVQTAEAQGVKPMTSDVFPPESFTGKTTQAATERIPIVGTGGERVAQQKSREQLVRNVLDEYGATEAAQASDDVMKDLLKKRGADLERYSTLKKDVIGKLSAGPEVTISKTEAAIQQEIDRLSALGNKDVEPLIKSLENAKESFSNKTLAQVEDNRKLLGETLESDNFASIKSQAGKVKSKLYRAVNEDMGEYIKANGDPRDFGKWKVANKRLENMAKNLDIIAFKSAVSKGNATPEEVRKMLFSKKPSDINRLYKSLTPEGKSRARVAILQEAVEKAGGVESLSTAKFRSALGRLEKSTGVFFRGEDKRVMDGLIKTLDLTKRAEVAGVTPPTGVQNFQIIGAFGLGTLLGGAKGAATAGSIGAAARLYESRPVRNLLIKIAKGSGNEQKYISALVKILRTKHQFDKKPVSAAEQRRALELVGQGA